MSAGLVALFAPYCQGGVRAEALGMALDLLAVGQLRGMRPLRPAGERPFVLRWTPGVAPLEPAQVELMVGGEGSAHYSFSLATHQLVLWLMDWLAAGGSETQAADLPESFWQWLLLGREPTAGEP
ncbi:type IV pilus biogenesis protein EbsA [Vulcanococcus sp.]|jgi:hypothetical protein|uniref:type IV pilus biogenesis protein EbsA n=1 Tax=Vulcanococcus sp. TaxID=2856995 RepID=UPI0032281BA5